MNFGDKDVLYYEAHITIEPVFDERLDEFKICCEKFNFRAADLMMKKRQQDKPERSSYDTFSTGRSQNYLDLYTRTANLCELLERNGFDVWRYKIEATLIDVRMK